MIFAGDEFCDQEDKLPLDIPIENPPKQQDPVNWSRKSDPRRQSVFEYTVRLIALRKHSPALGMSDTDFFHLDFDYNRRIMTWMRGTRGMDGQVVVGGELFGSVYAGARVCG